MPKPPIMHLLRSCVIGGLLTVLIVAADWAGWLSHIERSLYDFRARWFQLFTPAPTNRLCHVDIDDGSIEAIGEFPFPRTVVAILIEEIQRAGAAALGTDLLFLERQAEQITILPDGQHQRINHTENLAKAIDRFGQVIVPLSFTQPPRTTTSQWAARKSYKATLEHPLSECIDLVKKLNQDDEPRSVSDTCLQARRHAAFVDVRSLLKDDPKQSFEAIRLKLVPGINPLISNSPVLRVLRHQTDRARSLQLLQAHALPMPLEPLDLLSMDPTQTPLPELARVAASTGFVNIIPDEDGVVRRVPLLIEDQGHLYPQLGLSLACLMLGVDQTKVTIQPDRIVIPSRDGNVRVVPLHSYISTSMGRSVGMFMHLPWFGKKNHWETMYDPPNHASQIQHLPASQIWAIRQWQERLDLNLVSAQEAIKAILELTDPSKLTQLEQDEPKHPADVKTWLELIQEVLEDPVTKNWSTALNQMVQSGELIELPDTDRHRYKVFRASVEAIEELQQQIKKLDLQILERRAELRQQIKDRAVLLGWTATGVAADFVPTSLHAKCPGAVVHGVVFNAILTNNVWRRAPFWVTMLITLANGILIALSCALMTPIRAATLAVSIAGLYALINGLVLFDLGNWIVGLAGPLGVAGVVWSSCTLHRYILEQRERARITNRFRSYVDPALVNYVIAHPDRARLDGEVRELTVVFTDLAGFTTLTEQLREQIVPLLNEYMGLMIPVVRNHNGYVNKFLGDGIMCFFGAPWKNHAHATDAIATALDLTTKMDQFNHRLAQSNLPPVSMRIGVSTGQMIVGDAGSPEASDYTVLGDSVNLGARLESANKETGTQILVSDRTIQVLGDDNRFLHRRVGLLQVVGKTKGVLVHEVVAYKNRAEPEEYHLCTLTNVMVDLFIKSDFKGCLQTCDQVDELFGPSQLTQMYRSLCEQYLLNPPNDPFIGTIVLTEK